MNDFPSNIFQHFPTEEESSSLSQYKEYVNTVPLEPMSNVDAQIVSVSLSIANKYLNEKS